MMMMQCPLSLGIPEVQVVIECSWHMFLCSNLHEFAMFVFDTCMPSLTGT